MTHWLLRLSRFLGVLGMSLASHSVLAQSYVMVCYNWGCQTEASVGFSDAWVNKTLEPIRQAKNPQEERVAAAEAVRNFYVKAAESLPISADRPGNDEDQDVVGRMDCIDHSTTTANMLLLMQFKGVLRWHTVGPYAHRTSLVASHYSATLIETSANSEDLDQIYTIDPWAVEPGTLPLLSPVREWAAYRFLTLETKHHTTVVAPLAGR